jgi:endonuclease/exonuclease/phosphatase family metal-dependent hydrolase
MAIMRRDRDSFMTPSRRPPAGGGRGIVTARLLILAVHLVAWAALSGMTTEGGECVPSPGIARYVTLNLLHGGVFSGVTGRDQQLDERLSIVVEHLRTLDPDIVGLQEASRGGGRGSVAQRLAAELHLHYVYAPATPLLVSWLTNFSEGPAILSRFPIESSKAYPLSRCGRPFDFRTLLFALVKSPWGRLPVFSAHTSGDPCQTREVAEIAAARRMSLPGVLMGDFNAMQGSEAMAPFAQAGFVDAFRSVHPKEPGFTVWQRVDASVATVRRRVDYLFIVPGLASEGAAVRSAVVLNTPRHLQQGGALWASDHYGVMADIAVLSGAKSGSELRQDGCGSRGSRGGRP